MVLLFLGTVAFALFLAWRLVRAVERRGRTKDETAQLQKSIAELSERHWALAETVERLTEKQAFIESIMTEPVARPERRLSQ